MMATKAAWALASRLVKCGVVETEGLNQYPSHPTSFFRGRTDPSKWTGAREIGPLSLLVLQWINSVFGMEKLTPSRPPLALRTTYCLCSNWMFRR